MWAFCLNKFFGFDKVCFLEINSKKILSPGNLIKDDKNNFLLLGEHLEYKTLYKKFIYKANNLEIIESNLLSYKTINLIHRMVKTRFTSYKKILNLFLPTFNIEKLLKYKQTRNKELIVQELFIFPNLLTAYNITGNIENIFSSHNSNIQKIKLFRKIKSGKISKVYCSGSVIFQDWFNLKKITIYYPYKHYYKNKQDPRYNTFEVIKKMAKIYECKIKTIKNLTI